MVEFIAVLVVALMLWSVIRGSWSPIVLSAILTLFGLLLYLTGEPSAGGGDADPKRLIGMGVLTFAGPCTVLFLAIAAWRQRWSRRPADAGEQR